LIIRLTQAEWTVGALAAECSSYQFHHNRVIFATQRLNLFCHALQVDVDCMVTEIEVQRCRLTLHMCAASQLDLLPERHLDRACSQYERLNMGHTQSSIAFAPFPEHPHSSRHPDRGCVHCCVPLHGRCICHVVLSTGVVMGEWGGLYRGSDVEGDVDVSTACLFDSISRSSPPHSCEQAVLLALGVLHSAHHRLHTITPSHVKLLDTTGHSHALMHSLAQHPLAINRHTAHSLARSATCAVTHAPATAMHHC
jgi:hypothetical protein